VDDVVSSRPVFFQARSTTHRQELGTPPSPYCPWCSSHQGPLTFFLSLFIFFKENQNIRAEIRTRAAKTGIANIHADIGTRAAKAGTEIANMCQN